MGKTEKFDKIKYDNEYIKKKLDIIKFSAPKGEKDKIKGYAEQHGESISAYIRRAIRLIRWVYLNPGKIPPSDVEIEKDLETPENDTRDSKKK